MTQKQVNFTLRATPGRKDHTRFSTGLDFSGQGVTAEARLGASSMIGAETHRECSGGEQFQKDTRPWRSSANGSITLAALMAESA